MNIGFTGTRKGMSDMQRTQLDRVLRWLVDVGHEFHHGAAVGADTDAAVRAANLNYKLVSHPAGRVAGVDPLTRNKHIVAAADLLIAAPETDEEQQRSGTWATVRYARAAGKPVVMLSRGKE